MNIFKMLKSNKEKDAKTKTSVNLYVNPESVPFINHEMDLRVKAGLPCAEAARTETKDQGEQSEDVVRRTAI